MAYGKCDKCGKSVDLFYPIIHKTLEGKKMVVCEECNKTIIENERKQKLNEIENAPEIICPYCQKKFKKLTEEQYRESAELNVLKYMIVPAWGIVSALKNKPFIECPHCKMKIMQG